MPTGADQGRRDAPFQKIFRVLGETLSVVPGTDVYRWYLPDSDLMGGIIVEGVSIFIHSKTGTAGTVLVDVRNQTSSILSAAITTGADATALTRVAGVIANDGNEIVEPNRYIRIDCTLSAGTQSAATGYQNISVQIDYQLKERTTT